MFISKKGILHQKEFIKNLLLIVCYLEPDVLMESVISSELEFLELFTLFFHILSKHSQSFQMKVTAAKCKLSQILEPGQKDPF